MHWALLLVAAWALGCGGPTEEPAAAGTASAGTAAAGAPASSQRTEPTEPRRLPRARAEIAGLSIELWIDPLEASRRDAPELRQGDDVEIGFRIRYTGTQVPVNNANPAAWLDLRPRSGGTTAGATGAGATGADTCRRRIEQLVGGGLFARAELDLNTYYVLTLNDDATLSVVDPLFGFGGSKLLTLISLASPGEDWVLTPDGRFLFVSLPTSDRLVRVDTATWRVDLEIPTRERPTRLRLDPEQGLLWVAIDGGEEPGVSVYGAADGALRRHLPTGRGRHEIALDADGDTAFVTNSDDGTTTIVDARGLTLRAQVKTGDEPVSVAWSETARAAYVSHRGDGRIAVLSPERPEAVRFIDAEPGLGQLRFAPGGRLAFVLNPERDLVHVLDAARGRIVQTGDLPGGPDQVTFTATLAYLRHRRHETVLMVPLAALGPEGSPLPVVDFPGGQGPFAAGSGPALADNIVRAPGSPAVLVAHPADQMIYFYKEGMAAPMGSFRNYGREPRAVLVVDRSLREGPPGEYSTVARLDRAGAYELAFFLDNPMSLHCFPLEVAAAAGSPAPRRLAVEFLERPAAPFGGEPLRVRFRIVEGGAGGGQGLAVDDAEALVLRAPGSWHLRREATALGDGLYELAFTPPSAGVYFVNVGSQSAGLSFRQGTPLALEVAARR